MSNKMKLIVGIGLVALVFGCVPSLHPLYTDDDVVFEPTLLGEWGKGGDDVERWVFKKWVDDDKDVADDEEDDDKDAAGAYKLIYIDDDGEKGVFKAHLVKVGGKLFLDLFPVEPEPKGNDFYKMHLFPVHTFMYVEQIEPRLKMSSMDPGWIGDYLEEHPDALKHEVLEGDAIVLTAGAKELQAFVAKHVDTPDAFGEPSDLGRLIVSDDADDDDVDVADDDVDVADDDVDVVDDADDDDRDVDHDADDDADYDDDRDVDRDDDDDADDADVDDDVRKEGDY